MEYETYLLLGVILLIVGLAAGYVIKEKKKGKKCIGCPYADQCKGACGEKKENE